MIEKNDQVSNMFFKLASSFSGAYGIVDNINIFLDNNLIQNIFIMNALNYLEKRLMFDMPNL